MYNSSRLSAYYSLQMVIMSIYTELLQSAVHSKCCNRASMAFARAVVQYTVDKIRTATERRSKRK